MVCFEEQGEIVDGVGILGKAERVVIVIHIEGDGAKDVENFWAGTGSG